jgi:hypothetical protein
MYVPPNGIIVVVSSGVDRLIQEKRSQLKEAFATHQKAREVVAQARTDLLVRGNGPDSTHMPGEVARHAAAEIQKLESEERDAATRFKAISEELAQLHREKFGEWHITWRGPPAYR